MFTVQICKVLVCVKMELPPNSTQKKNPRDMVIGVLIAGETVVIFWRSCATEMSPNICQFMISQSMHDENSLPGWCFKGDLWGAFWLWHRCAKIMRAQKSSHAGAGELMGDPGQLVLDGWCRYLSHLQGQAISRYTTVPPFWACRVFVLLNCSPSLPYCFWQEHFRGSCHREISFMNSKI